MRWSRLASTVGAAIGVIATTALTAGRRGAGIWAVLDRLVDIGEKLDFGSSCGNGRVCTRCLCAGPGEIRARRHVGSPAEPLAGCGCKGWLSSIYSMKLALGCLGFYKAPRRLISQTLCFMVVAPASHSKCYVLLWSPWVALGCLARQPGLATRLDDPARQPGSATRLANLVGAGWSWLELVGAG